MASSHQVTRPEQQNKASRIGTQVFDCLADRDIDKPITRDAARRRRVIGAPESNRALIMLLNRFVFIVYRLNLSILHLAVQLYCYPKIMFPTMAGGTSHEFGIYAGFNDGIGFGTNPPVNC